MCTVLLPPGVNPILVNKYTNISINISARIQRGRCRAAVALPKSKLQEDTDPRDVLCSQIQPLKSADGWYVEILKIR